MRILKRLVVLFTFFYVIYQHAGVCYEQSCHDPLGRSGVCVIFKECPHLMGKRQTPSDIKFFKDSAKACNFTKKGSKDLYCCRKRQLFCGDVDGKRIANGNDSILSEFPFMVQVLTDDGLGNYKFLCGGSLIDSKNVITAAHCVTPKTNATHVLLGDYDRNTKEDCQTNRGQTKCADPPQQIRIQKIHRHEHFKESMGRNDIAILHLAKPADIEANNVQPICLPNGRMRRPKNLIIIGWGQMENRVTARILQKSSVTLSDCQKVAINGNQFCGQDVHLTGTCNGDSGGPAFGVIDNKRYFQFGVINTGPKNCNEKGISIFADITPYLNWIKEKRKT